MGVRTSTPERCTLPLPLLRMLSLVPAPVAEEVAVPRLLPVLQVVRFPLQVAVLLLMSIKMSVLLLLAVIIIPVLVLVVVAQAVRAVGAVLVPRSAVVVFLLRLPLIQVVVQVVVK